jgi:3-mercaptopyruvate sulfurtransferase SseA
VNSEILIYSISKFYMLCGERELTAAGYRKVFALKGGWEEWVASGYPVEEKLAGEQWAEQKWAYDDEE